MLIQIIVACNTPMIKILLRWKIIPWNNVSTGTLHVRLLNCQHICPWTYNLAAAASKVSFKQSTTFSLCSESLASGSNQGEHLLWNKYLPLSLATWALTICLLTPDLCFPTTINKQMSIGDLTKEKAEEPPTFFKSLPMPLSLFWQGHGIKSHRMRRHRMWSFHLFFTLFVLMVSCFTYNIMNEWLKILYNAKVQRRNRRKCKHALMTLEQDSWQMQYTNPALFAKCPHPIFTVSKL